MSALYMTAGERAVWTAVYAATWANLRGLNLRGMRAVDDDVNIARQAADEAWGAVTALREIAKPDVCTDFWEDASDVIMAGR